MLRDELVRPHSIVVVGGSNDLSRPGGAILNNIINGGFAGKLYVLNHGERNVRGLNTYGNVHSLPETECAIFAISSSKIISTAEQLALQKKTKAFIVLSAGFSETGPEGKLLEEQLASIVNNVNGTLIGPNCTGVILPGFAGTFAGPVPDLDPGGIDFVSASGAFAVFTLERAMPMGIRFSSVISVGNSAQCGVEEVIQHWDETCQEPVSKVKLLYMEQVRDPALLIKHCTSLIEKGCRIAAVKAGTGEAGLRAARSHTGALAGPDLAVDALFRKCGITRCRGREEFVYTAGVLMHRRPAGKNVAVITHAGGPGVLATDALTGAGLNVPQINKTASDRIRAGLFHGSSVSNPVDFLGTGTAEQLDLILDSIEHDCPEIDSSVVIFGSPGLTDVTPVYDLLDKKIAVSQKPVFSVLPSTMAASEAIRHFTGSGRIFFPDEVMLAGSLAAVMNTAGPFNSNVNRMDRNGELRMIIDSSANGYLAADRIAHILDLSGIPRVREYQLSSEDEIEGAVIKSGFPVVMKAAGLLHKSDTGGVKPGISSVDEAKNCYKQLVKISGGTGVILQQMLSGIELFIGAKRIPPYGHIILCGIGGIFIETLNDVSAGIVPVSNDEALGMIRRLRGYEILKGTRGRPGINEAGFAEIIVAVSSLLSAAPGISELDLNPLIGTENCIQSVDCRMLIKKEG